MMLPGWLLVGLLAANSADAITTHVAIGRGAREVILSQNPWTDDALVAGSTAGEVWCLSRLARTHPKLARGVAMGMLAFRASIVTSNLYQLRKQGK